MTKSDTTFMYGDTSVRVAIVAHISDMNLPALGHKRERGVHSDKEFLKLN